MSTQHLQEKWAPVLGHQDLPEIKDSYRRAVTAQLLENQEAFLREQSAMGQSTGLLSEEPTMHAGNGGFTNSADANGPVAGFDPVMIGLIRRAMPNLMAYDICGVQPMTGPTGLIFAMRSTYDGPDSGAEALFNEPDVTHSLVLAHLATTPFPVTPVCSTTPPVVVSGDETPVNSYEPSSLPLGLDTETQEKLW